MHAHASGFSSTRLHAITRRIETDAESGRIPGAVMLIAQEGEVLCEVALGKQDPGTGTPMGLDSIFRIYSMTKPIVSAAVMMLVEEGSLLLTDPVTKYFPELAHLKVGVETQSSDGTKQLALTEPQRAITLHDLLRHTAGFTYGIFGSSRIKDEYLKKRVGHPNATSDEFIQALAEVPLAYQPGTVWEYSVATDVLGVLLERLSGMPLDTYLRERVLTPLGMQETDFWVEPKLAHRLAEPFPVDPVTGAAVKLRDVRHRPTFLSGGGGMVSTVRDYLRFAQMLLNRGELEGVRLLSRKTVEYMASDHLGELPLARSGANYLPGPGYGFGLGFSVRTSTGGWITPGTAGDYAWSGVGGTYFWIDPQERMLAILLMQAPEQRLHYRQLYRNLVYGAML